MVSIGIVLAVVGIAIALGGIGITKTAFVNAKDLVKDVREDLGKLREDDSSQQAPEDRAIEDQ